MRKITVLAVLVLLPVTIAVQRGRGQNQPAPSITDTKIVTSSELATLVAGTPKDRNGNATFIRLAPYNVNMEHRIMGQAASVHETEAELFFVVEGTGTLVTGGKLKEEKRTNAENLSGSAIEGGVSKKVSKGDWIMVPAGVPHQFPSVDAGGLTLMSLHLPKKVS